jgi:hypothetical protein
MTAQKTGQTFRKIFIEGKEENLPKEAGEYLIQSMFGVPKEKLQDQRDPYYRDFVLGKPAHIKFWLNYVLWYLLPLPSAPRLTDSYLESQAKQYDSSAHSGQFAGEDPSYHWLAGAKHVLYMINQERQGGTTAPGLTDGEIVAKAEIFSTEKTKWGECVNQSTKRGYIKGYNDARDHYDQSALPDVRDAEIAKLKAINEKQGELLAHIRRAEEYEPCSVCERLESEITSLREKKG